MHARMGDEIVVDALHTGDHPRTGKVIEVLNEGDARHYRVRWADGHESLYFPSSDAHVVGGRPGQ